MVHHPELVVGKGVPGIPGRDGPVDSPPLALRWSIVMTRKSFLNSSIALIAAVGHMATRS